MDVTDILKGFPNTGHDVRVAPRIVRIYTLSLSLRTRLRLSWYSP